MRRTNNQKGITLIALVITIIILLILAGIAISSLTQTGLFSKAQEAKQKTEEKAEEENTTLNEYEKWIAKYENNGHEGQPITKVNTSETNPEGAMPKGATVIEGDADKGIVIKDSNDNEWVWVEVPKTIFTTAKNNTEYTNIKADLVKYSKEYRNGAQGQDYNWDDEWYSGCGIETKEKYEEMYNKMLSSVYTNGGFQIARYEAGIEGTNTDSKKDEIDSIRYKHSDITKDSPKAVSQADRIPYNYVYCSEAQTLASAMSTDSSKISSLLFGIQWDLTCKFIETKTELESKDIKADSTSWGNYEHGSITLTRGRYNVSPADSSSVWKKFDVDTDNYVTGSQTAKYIYEEILTTGASEDAKKMNIYDFAGNVSEWTLAHATSYARSPCASRGGCFKSYIPHDNASQSDDNTTTGSGVTFGFRSTLYQQV